MKLIVFLNGVVILDEYELLKELQNHFPEAIISAFTATADEETRADINNKLTNGKGKIFLYDLIVLICH